MDGGDAKEEEMRETTNKILEMVEAGIFDKDILIRDLLLWMSEEEVERFAHYAIDVNLDDDEGE